MSEKKYQRVAYQSESEGESDTESKNGEKKTKKRQVSKRKWVYDRTFEDQLQASQWIEAQKIWTCINRRDPKAGRTHTYRCNRVPYKGRQCAAAVELVFDATSFKVVMHTTEADHDHDEILDDIAQVGINCATKEVIKKLLEDMLLIKPKQIRLI